MIDYIDGTGGKFAVIRGDSHASAWTIQNNRCWHSDPALTEAMKHLKPGDWAVEIGSCIGVHTRMYAQAVGHTGQVIAFEANPEAAEVTAYNTRQFEWVEVRNLALGSHRGTARLQLDINAGASHLSDEGAVEVPLGRLDDELRGIHRIDWIKIDAEGSETAILSGARELIGRFRPLMLIEVNHGALERAGTSASQLLAIIESLGYRWRGIDERHDPRTHQQTDVLCEPNAKGQP